MDKRYGMGSKKKKYIVSINQTKDHSSVVIFDDSAEIASVALQVNTPREEQWMELDAMTLWESVFDLFGQALRKYQLVPSQIAGIGITEDESIMVLWDKMTGLPLYPCVMESQDNLEASNLQWILANVPDAVEKLQQDRIMFGTIGSFMLWKMTSGMVHACDYSSASRLMMYQLTGLCWDEDVLARYGLSKLIFPLVKQSSELYGYTSGRGWLQEAIPICSMSSNRSATLFGKACFHPGMISNQMGKSCSVLMATGSKNCKSSIGKSSVAWVIDGEVSYALEGVVAHAGSMIEYLKDSGVIASVRDSETHALQVPSSEGVYLLPKHAALLKDANMNVLFTGLVSGTTTDHMIRAALESIVYQTRDVITQLQQDAELSPFVIRVSGGVGMNDFLMQFQSDMLGLLVQRPAVHDPAALGVAYLTGLVLGMWDLDWIEHHWTLDMDFMPSISEEAKEQKYQQWIQAMIAARHTVLD